MRVPRFLAGPVSRAASRVCVLAACLVGIFTFAGWGSWGYSVLGDYALDHADALRVAQGDLPYRDFLPTYGALYMHLASPFFHLGQASFPSLWLATALLLLVEVVMLLRTASRALSPAWLGVLALLFVTTVAFMPNNAKFIMGFSQSGFLSSFLWVALLALLARGGQSWKDHAVAGCLLGLQPFTKIDMGFTAIAILAAWVVLDLGRQPRRVGVVLVGFLVTWLLVCLLLLARGGTVDLLLGSAMESLGQATLIRDKLLGRRFIVLAAAGGLMTIGLAMRPLRGATLKIRNGIRPCMIWLLPVVLILDAYRGIRDGSLQNLVFLDFAWAWIWVSVVAHLLAAVVRGRSLRPLFAIVSPTLLVILGVAGTGFLRCAVTGWYPLNYYQPAALLLGVIWFARLPAPFTTRARAVFRWTLIAGLALQLFISLRSAMPDPGRTAKVSTPFGDVRLPDPGDARNILNSLMDLHSRALLSSMPTVFDTDARILCTWEPSFQLLTGMKSSAFYTYNHRLGFCGDYRDQRERENLEWFHRNPPRFVVEEQERATFSKHFGKDFGVQVGKEIERDYEIVYQSNTESPVQRKVWRRKEGR